MTTIKVSHRKNYTCIDNGALRDRRLSYKARGIHHALLSFPDNWEVNVEHLAKESDHDGRDAVKAGLRELEEHGYLVRSRSHDAKGRFAGFSYTIYELPQTEKPSTGNPPVDAMNGKTIDGLAIDGKTVDGKSVPIINNEVTKYCSEQSTYSQESASAKIQASDRPSQSTKIAPSDPVTESSSVSQTILETKQAVEEVPPVAAPRFVPVAPPSSAERCDRSFQQLPWESWSNPEQGFLDWLMKNHLPFVSTYRDRPQITVYHAKEWLNKAKRDEQRWEQASLKYQEYAEQRDRPAPTYAPAIAESRPMERQRPNLEAVRAARRLAGLPEVHHAS